MGKSEMAKAVKEKIAAEVELMEAGGSEDRLEGIFGLSISEVQLDRGFHNCGWETELNKMLAAARDVECFSVVLSDQILVFLVEDFEKVVK